MAEQTFQSPDQAQSAVFRAGIGLVATFFGLPYVRYIHAVQLTCTLQGPVQIYQDAITPSGQIGRNSAGASNTWAPVNPRRIAYNAQVFVVWPNAAVTDSASAVVSSEGVIGG